MRSIFLFLLITLTSACSSIDFGPKSSSEAVASSIPADDGQLLTHGWCVAYLGVRITQIHGTSPTIIFGTCAVTEKSLFLLQWDSHKRSLYPVKRIIIADIVAIEREGPGRARPLIVQSGQYNFDTIEMRTSAMTADHELNDRVSNFLSERMIKRDDDAIYSHTQ